jgi:hypothetical protein
MRSESRVFFTFEITKNKSLSTWATLPNSTGPRSLHRMDHKLWLAITQISAVSERPQLFYIIPVLSGRVSIYLMDEAGICLRFSSCTVVPLKQHAGWLNYQPHQTNFKPQNAA